MLNSKSPPNLNTSPQSCRAGFLVVTSGAMMLMPGLSRVSFLLAVEVKNASHKASGEAQTQLCSPIPSPFIVPAPSRTH